ncbi:hypothetical protein L6164_035623 [Bauhinia variegata]|uniref:Uncharacterized protein n=1 Tax=Bauhinia variegata TaxID=167791 RepID=A0ACB9KEL1_BAUVA|nr:hypothetical protein L6164_035623 [Bauhinia variegata]
MRIFPPRSTQTTSSKLKSCLPTYTSLIHVLGIRNRMKETDDLFKIIRQRRLLPDLILIDGLCANGNTERALSILKEMDNMKIPPNGGLCKNQERERAEELLKEMVSKGITPDDSTCLSLIEAMG